jgi:hypothetical protein
MISGVFSMAWRKSSLAKAVISSSAFLFGSSRKKRPYRTRMLLELLEDRFVPTTITPTTFTDGVGSGSLRDVVLQFNADTGTGDDTINLLAGTYALTIVNTGGHHETAGLQGDLNITSASHRLIIQGGGSSGANATIVDASLLQDRVFEIVNPGTLVVFQDLVIQGGLAQDDGTAGALAGTTDALGGGILNNGGNITLDHVVVQNNLARGGDVAVLSAPGHNASGGGFYSTGGALTISGATIANNEAIGGRGGDYAGYGGSGGGGGLYATAGSLDISNSTIASNRATGGRGGDGALYTTSGYRIVGSGGTGQGGGLYVNGSSLTIATSTIASNQGTGGPAGALGYAGAGLGGGLSNGGTLTVSNSTLSGNSAYYGGGIYSSATLTISNSTLSGNSAPNGGGGIYNRGTLTVSDSTLSGNSAFSNGGGIANDGTFPVTLTNVTLTANRANTGGSYRGGGGLFVYSGAPVLHNTLIAGNFRGATGTTHDDAFGALDPGGDYNLIGDGTGMTGLGNGVNGNLLGSASAPIDPLLGPLQDNGGPTPTMALLPGSPALDAGNNAYATLFDQRGPGFPRVLYGAIDIGAVELARGPLLTVTSTLDEHSAGLLSLREALDQANSDAGRGQSDTIVFDPSLGNATITLSAGPLELSGASATATETIDGGGRVTVSGHGASRVFQIDAGVAAELDGLTISHGCITDDGGGILNSGTLTVSYSTLSANTGIAGGGISNSGTLTVSYSTLTGNTAGSNGGGIANHGTLTVSNSTLAANAAARDGGGLWSGPALGACTLTNVALSANRANTSGLAGHGGGVFVDPATALQPVLHNTLSAGNFNGATGTNRDDVNGALDSGGDYNLIGDGTGLTGLSNGVNGNLVGSAAAPIDPLLGPLQDNGGPTATMALLPGSPALDAGNNAYATPTDQRGSGFPRVLNGRIDIGAFEQAPTLLTVTSTLDVHMGSLLSLREALDEANRDARRGQSDTITFAASLGNATITLSAGQLELYVASATATETIDGGGRITVSGANASRVFQIDVGVRAELDGLTIANGRVTGSGGGIYNVGTLAMSHSTLSGNRASAGGGVYNGGTLTVSNSTLSGNTATGAAGYTANGGGGIYNSGTLTVSNSTLSGNVDTGASGGGGIYNVRILTVSNSTLSGNTGGSGGGGIWTGYGTLTLSNCTLSGNTASGGDGGGIYSNGGTLTVSNSTLSGNHGGYNGGGIYNTFHGTLTVSNSTLSGNSGAIYGGGIYNTFACTLTLSNSTLSGNSAYLGGGIYNEGTLTVSNSTLSDNTAHWAGGAIYMAYPGTLPVTLTNVTITANRANTGGSSSVHGGGLFVDPSSAVRPVLHNTLIAGNFNGATGTTRDDVFGALNPGGDYNLIGDGTGMSGLSHGVNGNFVGSAAAPIDALLGPLQDNGGPTKTHALLASSPALNAGNPSQLGVADQRGVVRAGGVNIGAYQASASAFVVTLSGTVAGGTPFDVTVQAVDVFGQVAFGYTGTVNFSVTDTDPAVVLPLDYTFTAGEQGTHSFSGEFTLITPGDQTLTVADLANGLSMDLTLTVNP